MSILKMKLRLRLWSGAVLANLTYRRRSVQDQVLELGGVELVLAHCQVPFFQNLLNRLKSAVLLQTKGIVAHSWFYCWPPSI